MPSGQTHDRITIWALPFIVVATYWQTRSSGITLLIAAGFMFGGLMFGPDLDIYSIQFQRWGYLRFIWLPYQKSLRHRSFLSHGPLIGTTLRVIYLCGLVSIVGILILLIAEKLLNMSLNWQEVAKNILEIINLHSTRFLALFIGLELGAMSHSISDWSNSAYKRFKKKGITSLLPQKKPKKRKSIRPSKSKARKTLGTRRQGDKGTR
ncbi:metal-binding protein [Plectonema cf. radiosum LEGE 06105]|uniref:Metal-binding protein n=1 Tax=Plectonema cf. radiosum LEGE 06105 TaxID=945769 RepID=A0A8J7F820_9CYAN|nr:metal-binding protein [Plectonema radiosum]MBE9216317.1 metal-binding protein [Plectonema cf. radiosum LEGE 06105]